MSSRRPQGEAASGDVATAPMVVEIRDLRTHFYAADGVVKALDGVSFSLREGEVLGIVGVSGSGKSVLAKSIMGLVRDSGRVVGGAVELRGEDLLQASPARLTEVRRNDVSLIVSSPKSRLNPVLNVGTQLVNVIVAKQGLRKRAAFTRAVDLLASVSIGDPRRVATSFPHELSGGMAQRVVIAMALCNSPRLLLADEPTAGLDVTVQLQVLELMADLVRDTGAALLLMTRDLGIIAHYAQRVAVLSKGHVIEARPVRDFFETPEHPDSLRLLQSAFAAHGEATGS